LTALAKCSACHPSGSRPDDAQLALASLLPLETEARAAAARDDGLVRFGGDVYLIACTGCHADERAAVGAQPGTHDVAWRVAEERATVLPPAGDKPFDRPLRTRGSTPVLSDDETAALTAFLRRHAAAIGPVRLEQPSTLL